MLEGPPRAGYFWHTPMWCRIGNKWERVNRVAAPKHLRVRPPEHQCFRGCFRGVFQRGISDGHFRGRGCFRGVSQTCGWLSGAILCDVPRRQSRQGFVFPKDTSAKGPAQRGSSSRISTDDGLGVPVGNSACSFPTTMLGKPRFPGGVSYGCFRGVFHRGVPDRLRPGATSQPTAGEAGAPVAHACGR